jgi:hypothetical protein
MVAQVPELQDLLVTFVLLGLSLELEPLPAT